MDKRVPLWVYLRLAILGFCAALVLIWYFMGAVSIWWFVAAVAGMIAQIGLFPLLN